MKRERKRFAGKVVIAALILTLALGAGYMASADDTAETGEVKVGPVLYDYADIIQTAMNNAAAQGVPLVLENPGGDMVYKVGKTLIIPDGLEIIGNGATILIDDTVAVNSANGKAFTRGGADNGAYFPYAKCAIMSEGMKRNNGSDTSFSITGLNFVVNSTANDTEIPSTLLGIRYAKDIILENCRFEAYSEVGASHTPLDVYGAWENVTITGCTFIASASASGHGGGVWIRNYFAEHEAGRERISNTAVIENCKFYNCSGDEILGIWGHSDGWVEDVKVRDCEFYMKKSDGLNPVHFISAYEYVDNIVFENNYIHMEEVRNSVMLLGNASVENGNILVKDNEIIVDDVSINGNAIFTSAIGNPDLHIENNSVTVNTKTGIKKIGVSAGSSTVSGNKFYGGGFSAITEYVENVYDNEVQACGSGFKFVTNCIGNTIHSSSGQAILIKTNDDSGNRLQAHIENNAITSSANSKCSISTNGTTSHVDVILKNNTLIGGEVSVFSLGATVQFIDNDFYLTSLNDILTGSHTTNMSGNGFFRLSTMETYISASNAPSHTSFNSSVPVGTFIGITKDTVYAETVAGPKPIGDIIGYVKGTAGSDASTWIRIYSQGTEYDTLTLTNLIQNPAFDGTDNWTTSGSLSLASNGDGTAIGTITSTSTIQFFYVQQVHGDKLIAGHKYYTSVDNQFNLVFNGTTDNRPFHQMLFQQFFSNGTSGGNFLSRQWPTSLQSSSGILPVAQDIYNTYFRFYYGVDYAVASGVLTGTTVTIGNVMVIDLTEAFGAGNEPTKAWCDENIDFFEDITEIKYLFAQE